MEQEHQKTINQDKPEGRWAPISAWGYLGIFLLLCIPIVNFILLIVWACGGCKKMNKTRMAQGLLLLFSVFLLIGTFGIVMLAKKVMQLVGDSDFSLDLPSLSTYTTVTKTLVEHGSELIEDVKSGDMEGMVEVWSSLDTEERTAILDMATENDTISDSIQDAVLPMPEEGKIYQTEIGCGSASEFLGYVQLVKIKGFQYEDFRNLGYSEEEAIENGYWLGTDGELCVFGHYEGDTVVLEYMSLATALTD